MKDYYRPSQDTLETHLGSVSIDIVASWNLIPQKDVLPLNTLGEQMLTTLSPHVGKLITEYEHALLNQNPTFERPIVYIRNATLLLTGYMTIIQKNQPPGETTLLTSDVIQRLQNMQLDQAIKERWKNLSDLYSANALFLTLQQLSGIFASSEYILYGQLHEFSRFIIVSLYEPPPPNDFNRDNTDKPIIPPPDTPENPQDNDPSNEAKTRRFQLWKETQRQPALR